MRNFFDKENDGMKTKEERNALKEEVESLYAVIPVRVRLSPALPCRTQLSPCERSATAPLR